MSDEASMRPMSGVTEFAVFDGSICFLQEIAGELVMILQDGTIVIVDSKPNALGLGEVTIGDQGMVVVEPSREVANDPVVVDWVQKIAGYQSELEAWVHRAVAYRKSLSNKEDK